MKLNDLIEMLETIRATFDAGEKEVVLDVDSTSTNEPRVATACGSVVIY